MLIEGVTQGVAGNALWHGLIQGWRLWTAGRITITSPRPLEILQDPQPLGPGVSYLVRGRLKHLSPGHKIWLLNERGPSREIWPQGFSPVQFNPDDGSWHGRINGTGGNIRIHALVAPPTSDEFFNYFQRVGDLHKIFTPLVRIPIECTNRAEVQPGFPSIITK